jgi:hypothetical protein
VTDHDLSPRGLWVAALRSGEYQQGHGRLAATQSRDGEVRFCCLGVACELFNEHHPDEQLPVEVREEGPLTVVSYAGRRTNLPARVREWLGLRDRSGVFHDEVGEMLDVEVPEAEAHGGSLAELNDLGVDFAAIADVIEHHVDALFGEPSL